MSIIKTLKSFFVNDELSEDSDMNFNNQRKEIIMNKAYYDLLSRRIKRRQDNLNKLERAVSEMQQTFKKNQTEESHSANLKALSAMIEIEESKYTEALSK